MNKQQYEQIKEDIPNFDKIFVKEIKWEDLEYDPHVSQARAAGHVITNVPRYAETMRQRGWVFPPGTVKSNPNGKWTVMDSMTRVLAAKATGRKTVRMQTYTDTQLRSQHEWADFQAQANDHPISTPNSDQDMEDHINKQVQNQYLERVTGIKLKKDQSTTQEFVAAGATHYKNKIYKCSGRNVGWCKNKIKKALKGKVIEAFENYTKGGTDLDFYKVRAPHWQGKEVGEIHGGRTVYVYDKDANWKQVIGNLALKIFANPGVKIDVIAYQAALVGKTNKDIVKYRKDVLQKIKGFRQDSKYEFLKSLENIYFLPQIKRDTIEDNKVIIQKDDMSKMISHSL